MADYVLELAEFAANLRLADLPTRVVAQAHTVVTDTVGVILAGSVLPEVVALAEQAAVLGPGDSATILGRRRRAAPPYAALVNGTGGVSLELDEGNQFAINHPSIHLLPAALAMAEHLGVCGEKLLEAVVAGYEVAVRVGRASKLRAGVHPFGTHAVMGATVAVAKLQGLGAREMAAALRVGAGMAVASSQGAANKGATVRNAYTGMTNMAGLMAPFLSTSGIIGEPDGIEVTFGYLLGAGFDPAGVVDDLGQRWYITQNYFKLQACSRWNHAPVEAIERLLPRKPFSPDQVEAILVETYDPAIRLNGRDPVNWFAAKHSIPYNVAAMICFGTAGPEAHTPERVADPTVREVAARVTVQEDPALTALTPDIRAGRVKVLLRDGTRLEEYVDRPRGGFDNPYTPEELNEKFLRLAGRALGEDGARRALDLCRRCAELPDVRLLTDALAG